MKMARLKSVSALLLALLMVAGMIVPVAAAEDDVVQAGTTSIEQVKEILGAATYEDYLTKYALMSAGRDDITLSGSDFDAEGSTVDAAQLKVSDVDGVQALYTPEAGIVQWKFTVQTEGMYNIALMYRQVDNEKASSIERIVRIDGKIPFKEARYITMTKIWSNDYTLDEEGNPIWRQDSLGNDMRPKRFEAGEWRTVQLEDSSAFYNEPFIFYLSAGEHTISMEAVREPVYVGSLRIYKAETVPTYEEYLAANSGKPEGTAVVKIQTEYPSVMSDISLYPIYDRTSPITEPQDASRIRLNTIGGDKWKQAGQWLRYEVEIPAGGAGMYSINLRFKQIVSGVYSSRSIRVNGETPFKEARNLRFLYNDNWQIAPLSNVDTDFKFYLEEGVNVIEMEVALGDMADVLRRVELSLTNMNEMYRKILMITGPSADVNRDYGFEKLIPDVLEGLIEESDNLYEISAEFEEIIGQKGEYTVLLDKIALLMYRMGNDTDKIASSLGAYKANIGSLGTWLLERRNQPLEVDYMLIQSAETDLPRADANFIQSFLYEVQAFFLSFFNDYSSIGSEDEMDVKAKDVVQVWTGNTIIYTAGVQLTTAGRDQAQIIRQMIDDSFTTETGVRVNLKLVAPGTLLPATLAGTGPDVAISMGAGDPVNYAIRSAVLPLNDFDTFDEVVSRFSPSAVLPLTLFDNNEQAKGTEAQVFGVPESQTFQMMFYRKDIFAELDIEIPKTWDDLYALVPVLQTKSMEVGIGPGLGTMLLFMFQQNEELYVEDGIKINLDSNISIDSFKKMTDLYTMYKFPITYDFANRFRTGEMPLGIAGYDTYNQLTVFAPEIRGLWEFVPMPGTVRQKTAADEGRGYSVADPEIYGENMIIDNDSVGTVTCSVMMKTARDHGEQIMQDSWAFMDWWSSASAQSRFGNEMVSILGAAAKQPTANIEALASMPWPTTDYRNLYAQFQHLDAAKEVPGNYIVGRYVDFAWKAVYNNGDSAVESILDNIPEIDKELRRKRSEFGMQILGPGQSIEKLEGGGYIVVDTPTETKTAE